jgi:hypothetical protein
MEALEAPNLPASIMKTEIIVALLSVPFWWSAIGCLLEPKPKSKYRYTPTGNRICLSCGDEQKMVRSSILWRRDRWRNISGSEHAPCVCAADCWPKSLTPEEVFATVDRGGTVVMKFPKKV